MRYGIKSITMDEIARSMGISKKTIYQHFPDKDEIVYQVAQRHLLEHQTCFMQFQEQSANALEECIAMTNFLRDEVVNMNPAVLYDMQKYHRRSWLLFQEHKEQHMMEGIKRIILRGQEEGVFRSTLNADIIATMRVDQVQQIFNPDVFPPNRFDYAQVHMQLLDHFVSGLLNRRGFEIWEEYWDKVKTNRTATTARTAQ